MPWRDLSPMDQRMQFVLEYHSGLFTMTELVHQYGISRPTGYKWLARYDTDGVLGLRDRSRRPHHSPHVTETALIDALLAERCRHPRWGAKKLLALVRRRQPDAAWPSRSTVCTVLTQHGLVSSRRRRDHSAYVSASPVAPMTAVNDVWTTDFKGEFRTGDGAYCYPFTLRDGFSRYVLRCDALVGRTYELTRRCFARAFAEFGLPDRMRSDNGVPFASTGFAGLSRLAVWWMRLGIVPERIAAGHPEQNGSHEQFHSVLKRDTTRPPAIHAGAQQRRFARFCREYNYERPHEALHDEVPARYYHPSFRALPRQLPALDYPGHFEIRRVSGTGQVSWGNVPLFVCEALAGEDVGFEAVDDGLWTLFFGAVALGRFNERQRRIHPLATFTEGRSASVAGSAPDSRKKKE
jgi:putative transposase